MTVEARARAVIPLHLDLPGRADHERASLLHFATRLAALTGSRVDADARGGYYLPMETLLQADAAAHGISGEADLFGGVVPQAFVATKLISHGLWPGGGDGAPEGWVPDLGEALGDAVLPGYSVFTAADLRAATLALLEGGPVRCKLAGSRGGNDQKVVTDAGTLETWVAGLAAEDIHDGVVVERDLHPADTFSVGCVRLSGHDIAYFGSQRSIRGPKGNTVYGGSRLRVTRGTLDALHDVPLPNGAAEAIAHVQRYEAEVERAYPGFFASRRNYDLVRGRDGEGRIRCGVLEQSWRFGGASLAEIMGIEALAADASLPWVDAWTYETYEDEEIPERAVVYFRDRVDSSAILTKYAMVLANGSQP